MLVMIEPTGIWVSSNNNPGRTCVTTTPECTRNFAFSDWLSGLKLAPILLYSSSADLLTAVRRAAKLPASALSVTDTFFSSLPRAYGQVYLIAWL